MCEPIRALLVPLAASYSAPQPLTAVRRFWCRVRVVLRGWRLVMWRQQQGWPPLERQHYLLAKQAGAALSQPSLGMPCSSFFVPDPPPAFPRHQLMLAFSQPLASPLPVLVVHQPPRTVSRLATLDSQCEGWYEGLTTGTTPLAHHTCCSEEDLGCAWCLMT
jgi:hypothetical protein